MAAQEALRESERRFRLLVEGVVDYAIYMLDPSGIVASWNAGAERIKGYTADEIIGQHFSRFYTHGGPRRRPAGARAGDRRARGPLRGRGLARAQGRQPLLGLGGASTPSATTTGELVGFAKITRDITERRAAQEALRESERAVPPAGQRRHRLRASTCSIPNGIVTAGTPAPSASRATRADEIIGQHFSRFYTEHDRAAGVPAQRAAARPRTRAASRTRAGACARTAACSGPTSSSIAIRDESGRLVGFAKITRDITERREAQLALQEAQAQRAQAQKMEAIGQLTGGVAHDFNNLLMIVSGHAELMKRSRRRSRGVARRWRRSSLPRSAARRSPRQLLTFSRRQIAQPQVVAGPRASASQASRSCSTSSLGARSRLATAVAADCWPVRVDPGEFELALVNLALNARDAMPDGGMVTLTAENVTLHAGRTRRPASKGEFVALAVSPTPASGIAPDLLPRCSTRSSPPRRSAREAGSACRRSTASRISPAARVDDARASSAAARR